MLRRRDGLAASDVRFSPEGGWEARGDHLESQPRASHFDSIESALLMECAFQDAIDLALETSRLWDPDHSSIRTSHCNWTIAAFEGTRPERMNNR